MYLVKCYYGIGYFFLLKSEFFGYENRSFFFLCIYECGFWNFGFLICRYDEINNVMIIILLVVCLVILKRNYKNEKESDIKRKFGLLVGNL